jgi:hypothetical protein
MPIHSLTVALQITGRWASADFGTVAWRTRRAQSVPTSANGIVTSRNTAAATTRPRPRAIFVLIRNHQ